MTDRTDNRPETTGKERGTDTRRPPRRRILPLLVAALAAAGLLIITPLPRGFQGQTTGDPELLNATAEALGSSHWNHIAVVKVDGDTVTAAGTGADEDTEFEIGSITKTFTAALFADALERGEVTESTRLGEVWPQLDGAVAEVRLADLAMQRSGLPRQQPPPSLGDGIASILAGYVHTDPYRGDVDDLVRALGEADVSDKKPEYSNFGFAVLGQALAEVTGTSYADLVRERITQPLGMDETFVATSAKGLSHGMTSSGLPAAPWTLGASAPAGAIRSTPRDMTIWLRATMDGTAPGAAASEPRTGFDESDRIGWAWMTTTNRSPNVTWHNGGTGGYRSFLGFDRENRTGIVILSDSANSVDGAISLISEKAGTAAAGSAGSAADSAAVAPTDGGVR